MDSVKNLLLSLLPTLTATPPHIELLPAVLRSFDDPPECQQEDFYDHIASAVTARSQEIRSSLEVPRPRPAQGGRRISKDYLRELRQSDCLWRFRFTADELIELASVLRLPPVIITRSRYRTTRLEALALTCARLAHSGDLFDLVKDYDRSESAISEIFNHTVRAIDDTWAHLLDFDSNRLLSPQQLASYAASIRDAGAPTSTVWGFIDCTIRRIARPSRFQRAAYNGYKKYHALKYQAVLIPNGLFAHLFGPWEGRRTDPFLLSESGLLDRCAKHAVRLDADDGTPVEHRYFQLFGDPAYGVSPLLISPYSGPGQRSKREQIFNHRMSSVRIEVEHGFGIVLSTWPFLYTFWKHRVYMSPLGRYYRTAVLLTNARSCFHPNQVALHFNCRPPELDEYFHL
ncbi:hypothetical protein VTO73DRAFT_4199 [Trametes versicolor]